jgi:ABC-type nitrate/sulfonate/bicarbonate transport system permease component
VPKAIARLKKLLAEAMLDMEANGVRNVDTAKVCAAQALGATGRQLIRHIVLPHALPDILSGIPIGLGWSTLVAAELVSATRLRDGCAIKWEAPEVPDHRR